MRRKAKIYRALRDRQQYAYGPLGARIFAPLGSADFNREIERQSILASEAESGSLGELLASFVSVAYNQRDTKFQQRYNLISHWLDTRRNAALADIDVRYLQKLWEQARLARGLQFANNFLLCLHDILIWGQNHGRHTLISETQLPRLPALVARPNRRNRMNTLP